MGRQAYDYEVSMRLLSITPIVKDGLAVIKHYRWLYHKPTHKRLLFVLSIGMVLIARNFIYEHTPWSYPYLAYHHGISAFLHEFEPQCTSPAPI